MDPVPHEHDDQGRTATHSSGGPRPTYRDGGDRDGGAVTSTDDVEEFLALVAHELRTPQAMVSGAAEALTQLLDQGEPDRAEVARIADVLHRHSHLSTRLVARLRLAHKIGRGTVELETEEVDLGRLVGEVVSDVAAFVLPARTVTVSADGPVPAVVDRASISEIVFNLLDNAHKYSAAEASIEVQVERDEGRARVVVRDQGSGVAPGDTDAIFEPFVQSGPNRGGVGLGLYVSRELARAHGGELSLRPATDTGSEFVLELPIAAA